MAVLISILKITGMVLLGILAVLLLVLLIVLLVPIRYNGRAEYHDRAGAEIKAGWIFHMISFRMLYSEGRPEAGVYLFGRKIKTIDIGSSGREESETGTDADEADRKAD